MFLGQLQHLIVKQGPVTGIFADGDDRNKELRRGGEIGCLGVGC